MIVVNTFMAFSGHELYRDSPGTFFIVIVYAMIFVAPATAVFTCVAFDWRRFTEMFRPASSAYPRPLIAKDGDEINPYESLRN